MIFLREGQACPYAGGCPYNTSGQCQGARSDRVYTFECDRVNQDGTFYKGMTERSPLDQTGKQQVIME